jgi:putative protein-disulfide isomerase
MIMGERIEPVGNMSAYILESIPKLEHTSGLFFGQPYIELIKEGSYITSSEKPSVALCVYKSLKNIDQIAFAHAIQKLYFIEAQDLNQDSTYANLAFQFGIDKIDFLKRMQDATYFNLAHAEFDRAANLGVNGFPTLLEKTEKDYKVINEGYTNNHTLEKYLNKAVYQKNAD